LPFLTMVSTVSRMRGCAWPTSSTCMQLGGRAK
jgi:hypothetical protein